MLRPHRGSGIIGAVLVLCVLGSEFGLALEHSSEEREELHLVASLSDAPSRMMAIGFSSLANLHISSFDIDIDWSGLQDDTLAHVAAEGSDFGLLDLEAANVAALGDNLQLHAVMKFWFEDDVSDGTPSNGKSGYLLVAKKTLAADIVRELVVAILADKLILKISGIDRDRLPPSTSMIDLPLPLHQGVDDYLIGEGIALQRNGTLLETQDEQQRSFTLYFDTNDSGLERDDLALVAEACKFAATLQRARFVISGHTDTTGSTAYNNWLSARRSAKVASAIRNDPRFRESLSVLDFGEQRLAISTGDGVPEAMNRRVEITIMPDS